MASLHEHLALPSVVASVGGVGSPLSVERVEDEIVVVDGSWITVESVGSLGGGRGGLLSSAQRARRWASAGGG